jgi:hypothetical protein
LFDKVFTRLGQKALWENHAFQIDNEMKAEHFVRFHSKEKDNKINMMFEISTSGLTFWLDRTNEIPEWSIKFIRENKQVFANELMFLFDSEVLVEYKGNRTTIIFLDKGGVEIRRFTYNQAFSINWLYPNKKKTFRPYFEN